MLIDIYDRIKNQKEIVVQQIGEDKEEFDSKAPRVLKNIMSL